MSRHLWSALALTALVSSALGIAACADGDNEPPHPTDRLDFPVSVTADPSGTRVWVVSGNFNLAYRNAAVLAFDVESGAFEPDLAFQVGGFPGPVSFLEKDGSAVAAYVASRDDDRLYFATLTGDPTAPTVACPGGKRASADSILECPKSGALFEKNVETDDGTVTLSLGQDPYGLLVAPARSPTAPDLLLSAALTDGRLATFALAADGTPTLVGNADLIDGLFGLASNPATGRVYATSKLANVFPVLSLAPRPDASNPDDTTARDPVNPWVTQIGTVAIPEPAATDRARSVAVSRDGTRLYAAYRAPSSLVIVDISDTKDGQPSERVVSKVPLAAGPSDVVVVPGADGQELVYVSCFSADRIEVVDPRSGTVVGDIVTGSGPSGMTWIDHDGLRRLYVALFNDNAVGVIELDPGSPHYHTEIGEVR